MEDPRAHLVRVCKLAYDRKILDSAGGNVTTRIGGDIYMTRSYAGGKHQWDLRPGDILRLNLEGDVLDGEGEFSREGAVHMACYREFPEAGCVFHAHSLNLMVFVANQVPMPPMSEQTDKYGTIGFCEWAATHTPELAVNVVAALRPQAHLIPKQPIATFIPRHGIFVVGKDLNATYDALERLERNAYIALMSRLLR
ncbi:MAG: class II aldolase/adducin family protein [Armatimonadota bacterium]